MTNFKGLNCPVCNIPLSDSDDIVVCPECGAPYHRACYKQIGHCIYNHEAGEQWKDPRPAEEEPKVTVEQNTRCPQCGTENPAGAVFCNKCGRPLQFGQNVNADPNAAYNNFFTAASGLHPDDLVDDDVTVNEASKLVQINSLYYVPLFKSIRERKRSRFNFSALLFGSGWLLYRKMYKLGIVLQAVRMVMGVLPVLISAYMIDPLMIEICTKCGIDPMLSSFTQEQAMIIAAESQNYPQLGTFLMLSYVPLILNIAMNVFLGFMGNRLYYKHVTKKVREIREKFSGEHAAEYESTLMKEGSVNPKVILILAVLQMLVQLLTLLL